MRRLNRVTVIVSMIVCCAALGLVGCPRDPNPFDASLVFSQLDINENGNVTLDSSWGSVEVEYNGSDEILYFNLVVNGAYVVKNVPFLSPEGAGVAQGATVRFNLGVSNETDVASLEYAFSLDTAVSRNAPTGVQDAVVGDQWSIIYDGILDAPVSKGTPPSPPETVEGGRATGAEFHGVKFPNQDCAFNECCPAAVANSLQFLRNENDLPLADDEISIEAMVEATGWNDGCNKETWWQLKDAVMSQKGIKTEKIDDIEAIFQEIKDGHDVELIVTRHAVVLTGLVRLSNGHYLMQIVHDSQQGMEGGTKWPEHIEYDPVSKRFSGAEWAQDKQLLYFVSESPE